MPFTVGWYDMGMLVDCTGSLGHEAANTLLQVVVAALDSRPCPTNVILDWRGCRGDPARLQLYTRRVASLSHSRLGRVAAVLPVTGLRPDPTRLTRDRPFFACTSLEEAVYLLKEYATPANQTASS